jgi:transcriptional regulator with XRE-family HTH domain
MGGLQVKYYRKLYNMSQEFLAACMGFPPNTISKIEHGTRKVTLEEAVRFAEIFRVSLNTLAGIPEKETDHPIDTAQVQTCAREVQEAIDSLTTVHTTLVTLVAS